MKRFIFKVDDFRLTESLGKFERLIRLCERQAVPASIGVIGAALKGGRFRLQELFSSRCSSGHIELWNHSLNHKDMTQLSDSEVAWEIAATNSLSERLLGHRPIGFGAPFNKCDERVARIARELGMAFTYEASFASAQVLTPEYNVPLDGQPNLGEFVKRAERKAQLDTLIVQVHPGRWLGHGFEQMERCFDWLREAGYEPVTVQQALGLAGAASVHSKPTNGHELLVRQLSAHWSEQAPRYDAELSNFSSYFLGRFKANALDIARLLETLDADLGARNVVDVGCGLAQWGLPFFDFNRDAKLWAFDTNKVLSGALAEAHASRLIPYDVRVLNEDFTTTDKLAKGSVDHLVCANALNYIPTLAFVRQAQLLCREGGQVLLLNQTGDFNHLGVLDALGSGNVTMAKERALCALRQKLVRLGFSGFMPARTTPSARELETVFHAFGFQLSNDFAPAWERSFRGHPTFEGLVFSRHHWVETGSLPPAFRPEYRRLLCQAGFPDLDDELFAQSNSDLEEPELARLKARSGSESLSPLADTLKGDNDLGRLSRLRQFSKVSQLVANSGTHDPDWLLAGAVAALIEGDNGTAEALAGRRASEPAADDERSLLNAMCRLAAGDSAGALASANGSEN